MNSTRNELEYAVEQLATAPEDALATLQRLSAEHSNDNRILKYQAIALRELGRVDEAISLIKASGNAMADADLLVMLGSLEQQNSMPELAAGHYQQSIQVDPDYMDAYIRLANILVAYGMLDNAVKVLRHALQRRPDEPLVCYNLGKILATLGEKGEALDLLYKSQKLMPENDDIPAAITGILIHSGKTQSALDILERLLNSATPPPEAVINYAELVPAVAELPRAISYLEKLLERNDLAVELKARARFSLGRLFDLSGNYKEAFENFRLGNDASSNADTAQQSLSEIEIIKQVFHSKSTDTAPSGAPSNQPIFIVGLPRSGTTLAEKILASHPDIAGGGELTYIGNLLNSFPQRFGPERQYPFAVPTLTAAELTGIAREYLAKLNALAPGAARITDKMPHNFLHLGLIARLFPRAHVIHCIRDPMDNCLSIYSRMLSRNHPYATRLDTLGAYYLAYRDLMNHWKQTLDIRIHDLVYENLVTNQESVTRSLVSFCGLEWDESCLKFNETEQFVNSPSHQQVRRKIYTDAIARWKNYAPYLTELSEVLEADRGHSTTQ